MLHVFTYSGVSLVFENGDQCMVVKFWIAGRYLAAMTLLGSTVMLFRITKSFSIFPECYVLGQGLTAFKVVSEYLISAVFLLTALMYFKLRKNMDHKLFFYMECHLLSISMSEILFTGFFSPYDWTNIWSHIIRVVSYLFLYKAIIENCLRRPYAAMFHKIDKMDTELHMTTDRLEQEQQRSIMEEMLLKNDQCYELIINNSSDAITVTSDHKLIFANERAARILEVASSSDIIGRELLDFIHPKERDRAQLQALDHVSRSELPIRQEYRTVTSARKGR